MAYIFSTSHFFMWLRIISELVFQEFLMIGVCVLTDLGAGKQDLFLWYFKIHYGFNIGNN